MNILKLIKLIRVNCGITQCELSKITGIQQSNISKYENGKSKPALVTIKKLVDVANTKAGINLKYTDIED